MDLVVDLVVVVVVDLRVDDDVDLDVSGVDEFATTITRVRPKGPHAQFSTARCVSTCHRVSRPRRGHHRRYPQGQGADQLVRAAESVVRNIAEGAGRRSEGDSAKHYKIARGEAMECAASLDVMKLRKLVGRATLRNGDSTRRKCGRDVDQDDLAVNERSTRSTSSSTLTSRSTTTTTTKSTPTYVHVDRERSVSRRKTRRAAVCLA